MGGYGDNYRAYNNTSNSTGVRTGDRIKPNHVMEKRVAGHGHRTGYLVAKIEHTVYSVLGDNRDRRWDKPGGPAGDRTSKVHDFIGKIQNEASRIMKPQFAPLSTTRWTVAQTHDGNNLSGKLGQDYNDLGNKEPPPAMISTGGWVRPNRAMWASPPGSLSQPTNDVGQAMEYLKGRSGNKTSDGRKVEKKSKWVSW